MIGSKPSAQQLVVGRVIRLIGSGLTGVIGIIAMAVCVVLNLIPRQTTGCIVETGPDILGCLIIVTGGGMTAALLSCARTTTAGLIGSVLLGMLAMMVGPNDDFAGFLALGLAAILLVTGVTAKCIEEFPTVRPTADHE